MPNPSVAGQVENAIEIDDFELVRNGAGEWLLLTSGLPAPIIDNPLCDLQLSLNGTLLMLESADTRVIFSSLMADSFGKALIIDRPESIILCVVNDEGIRTFSRTIPVAL